MIQLNNIEQILLDHVAHVAQARLSYAGVVAASKGSSSQVHRSKKTANAVFKASTGAASHCHTWLGER